MEKKEMLELVREYLYRDSLDEVERKILLKLYINYIKLKNIKNKNIDNLANLEDKIYCVDDKYISDTDKINIEIKYYNNKAKNTSPHIQELITIVNKKIEEDNLDENDIMFLKQRLVEIQILTDRKITFLEASFKLFEDYCKRIKEKLSNNKKKK